MEIQAPTPEYKIPNGQTSRCFRVFSMAGLTGDVVLEAGEELGIEKLKLGDFDGDTWKKLEELCRKKISFRQRPMKVPARVRK